MASDDIPATSDIRARLQRLSTEEVRAISAKSGVPYTTLWKIRAGGPNGTDNPGIETVRQFIVHLPSESAEASTTRRSGRREQRDGPSYKSQRREG